MRARARFLCFCMSGHVHGRLRILTLQATNSSSCCDARITYCSICLGLPLTTDLSCRLFSSASKALEQRREQSACLRSVWREYQAPTGFKASLDCAHLGRKTTQNRYCRCLRAAKLDNLNSRSSCISCTNMRRRMCARMPKNARLHSQAFYFGRVVAPSSRTPFGHINGNEQANTNGHTRRQYHTNVKADTAKSAAPPALAGYATC